MNIALIPARILVAAAALNIVLVLGAIWQLTSQPWLGMILSVDSDVNEVQVTAVDPKGPAVLVPTNRRGVSIKGVILEPSHTASRRPQTAGMSGDKPKHTPVWPPAL